MNTSILATLGLGSGIDTSKLIADLTSASRAPRQKSLDDRSAVNSARLSAVAALSSGLTTLATSTEQRLRSLADVDIPSFVEDLVGALNAIHAQLADATRINTDAGNRGPLSGDTSARVLGQALSGFVASPVAGATTFARLSDIGIATTRDGSLSLDNAKLSAAITADPAAVKALLGVGSPFAAGIARNLVAIRDAMTGPAGTLTLSKAGYDRANMTIRRDQERLDSDIGRLTDRLTASFSAMDRQVAAIKASQAYLQQQVAVWTAAK